MKNIFKLLICSASICLSSCQFNTFETRINFLFSKYSLLHAYDYSANLMTNHNFVDIKTVTLRDKLFSLKDNIFYFYPFDDSYIKPYFDIDICMNGKEKTSVKQITYTYSTTLVNNSHILVDSDLEFFAQKEITVFSNFWLRVHTKINDDTGNYDLILEYKNIGRTIS